MRRSDDPRPSVDGVHRLINMSDLYRSSMLNRLPHAPTVSPYADNDDEDNEQDENDSLGDLPSMGPPRS